MYFEVRDWYSEVGTFYPTLLTYYYGLGMVGRSKRNWKGRKNDKYNVKWRIWRSNWKTTYDVGWILFIFHRWKYKKLSILAKELWALKWSTFGLVQSVEFWGKK